MDEPRSAAVTVATIGSYVTHFANYSESYGTIGVGMVLMLWFDVSAFALLAGAEVNAKIDASPHGKDKGEKVAGQKRMMGAAAARAFEEQRHS